MKIKNILVCISVFCAAAGLAETGAAQDSGFGGYRAQEKLYQRETVLPLKLESSAITDSYYDARMIPDEAFFSMIKVPTEGFLQSYFHLGINRANRGNEMASLALDLVSLNPAITKDNFKPEMLTEQPEQFNLRVLCDINNDHSFSQDEIQILKFPPKEAGAVTKVSAFIFDPLSTMPDGQPAKVEITINFLMQPSHRIVYPGQLMSHFVPRARVSMPLSARLKTSDGEILIALNPHSRGTRSVGSYSLYRVLANTQFREPSGDMGDLYAERNNYLALDQWKNISYDKPFNIDGKWWLVASIEPQLTTLTLAQPVADFTPTFTAQVGETAPEWTRIDVVTRQLIMRSDSNAPLVMIFSANRSNADGRYNGYRLVGERLAREAGTSIRTVFIENEIEFEEFIATTAGISDLHYALVGNQEKIIGNESQDRELSLRKQMWLGDSSPAAFLIAPDGKILLRVEKPLLESLAPIILELRKMKSDS